MHNWQLNSLGKNHFILASMAPCINFRYIIQCTRMFHFTQTVYNIDKNYVHSYALINSEQSCWFGTESTSRSPKHTFLQPCSKQTFVVLRPCELTFLLLLESTAIIWSGRMHQGQNKQRERINGSFFHISLAAFFPTQGCNQPVAPRPQILHILKGTSRVGKVRIVTWITGGPPKAKTDKTTSHLKLTQVRTRLQT